MKRRRSTRRSKETSAGGKPLEEMTLEEIRAETERLENQAAEIRRTHISRGELRETLAAVESRLNAWWSGGDLNQTRIVVASTLGMAVDRVTPEFVEHARARTRDAFEQMRSALLGNDAPDAQDYAIPRRPEVVAMETDRMWERLLLTLGREPFGSA